MNEGTSTEIFTKEIAELEAKLAAKKQELVLAGQEVPEKHLLKEVIKDHAFVSEGFTPDSSMNSAAPTTSTPHDIQQTAALVDTLIAEAFTRGISTAVASARKEQNPYLLELLHDRLVDTYYEKLLHARKINPI